MNVVLKFYLSLYKGCKDFVFVWYVHDWCNEWPLVKALIRLGPILSPCRFVGMEKVVGIDHLFYVCKEGCPKCPCWLPRTPLEPHRVFPVGDQEVPWTFSRSDNSPAQIKNKLWPPVFLTLHCEAKAGLNPSHFSSSVFHFFSNLFNCFGKFLLDVDIFQVFTHLC